MKRTKRNLRILWAIIFITGSLLSMGISRHVAWASNSVSGVADSAPSGSVQFTGIGSDSPGYPMGVDAQYFSSPTPAATETITGSTAFTATPSITPSVTASSGRFVFGNPATQAEGSPTVTATAPPTTISPTTAPAVTNASAAETPATVEASSTSTSRFQFTTPVATPAPTQIPVASATEEANDSTSSYFKERMDTLADQDLNAPSARVTEAVDANDASEAMTGRQTTSSSFLSTNLSNYNTFVSIRDDAERYIMEIPEPWSDLRWRPWRRQDRTVGTVLTATSDLGQFDSGWNTPGMLLGIVTDSEAVFTSEQLLNSVNVTQGCTYNSRYSYGNERYSGVYDIWTNCGDTDAIFLALAAQPLDAAMPTLFLRVKVLYDADVEAFERIIATFGPGERFAEAGAQQNGPALQPTPNATATASASDENAPVRLTISSLNMRAGPGVNYDQVSVVRQGDLLELVGQAGDCAWLQVRLPNGTLGWISGGAQYVERTVPCLSVPEIAPSAPPPSPNAPAGTDSVAQTAEQLPVAENEPVNEAATESATENVAIADAETAEAADAEAADASVQFQSEEAPPGQACVTFREEVGAEVTATFTRQDQEWSTTFMVPRRSEVVQCFDPGEYTYTFDAPPPLGSTNGRFTLSPGEQRLLSVVVE